MSLTIIGDSLFDLNEDLREEIKPIIVPLKITIGDKNLVDDEKLDRSELLDLMKSSKDIPKTASPSPYEFIKAFEGVENDNIFCITCSSKLSATYNHALIAKGLYLEKTKDKIVNVLDSLSACGGETLIGLKLLELDKLNIKPDQMLDRINAYISEMRTYFVLESLDNLVKAGRINKVVARVATAFSIKPIMAATDEGDIMLCEKARGTKNALKRLVEIIGEQGDRIEEKIISIAHCNCLQKAEKLKIDIMGKYNFRDIIIVDTGGVSSVYANDGGIVISF